jgi:hypothetical protein
MLNFILKLRHVLLIKVDGMNRAKINFYLDILMILLFVIAALTSVLLFIGRRNITITLIHEYLGLAFIAVMTMHLLLHANWLVAMLKNK